MERELSKKSVEFRLIQLILRSIAGGGTWEEPTKELAERNRRVIREEALRYAKKGRDA